MNVKKAVKETAFYIEKTCWDRSTLEYGKDHLWDMASQVQTWDTTNPKINQKAMRWLGWLQAAIVIGGGATLEDMKKINKEA